MKVSTLKDIKVASLRDKEGRSAKTANGSRFQFLASVDIPVKIGNHTYNHTFQVSRDDACPAPALLGMDFVRTMNKAGHKVTFDTIGSTVEIGQDCVPLIHINNVVIETVASEELTVRMKDTAKIAPRTETLVKVYIENFDSLDSEAYQIEDNQREDEQMYVVGRALVKPSKEGLFWIPIMNPSAVEVTLYKETRIAKAFSFKEEQLVNSVEPEGLYVPPEAHWESNLPQLHQPENPNYDIASEVDLSNSRMTEEQKEKLRTVIRKHKNAFVGADNRLGRYSGPIRHRVDLIEGSKIPARKVYRVPLEKRKEIENQIDQMLDDGIIRHSNSPFSAPIVLVRKADKTSWRFAN